MDFLVLTKAGGILGPIAQILGWVMEALFRFTSMFGVVNIGLCIILFTIVTRLLLFPLTIKQQKTSKLMSVMQPELNAIQKKYKGKEDSAVGVCAIKRLPRAKLHAGEGKYKGRGSLFKTSPK